MSKRRLFYLRLILIFAGTLLPCLVFEVVLRVRACQADARERQAWVLMGQVPAKIEGAALFYQLVRLSPHDDIVYELRPDLDCSSGGVPVGTGPRGWRRIGATGTGGSYLDTYRRRPVRIVGLGDSVMFGWGVSGEETFMGRLQTMLAASHPERSWHVTSTAVPGYNTVMEVATLRRKALHPIPDLVIIDFVGNDLDLPHFISEPVDYCSLSRSFLLEHLFLAFAGVELQPARPLVPVSGLFSGEELDHDRVPGAYRHLVGLEPYRKAMRELERLSVQHGFQVLVTTHLYVPDFVKQTCAELGLPLLECGDRFHKYMREHDIQEYFGSALTNSKEDPHPSSIGHRLVAETLHEYLQQSGLLSRMAAPR